MMWIMNVRFWFGKRMVILIISVNCYMNCKHDLCSAFLELSMNLA